MTFHRLEDHPIIVISDVLENPHDFISEVVEKIPMQYNELGKGDRTGISIRNQMYM